MDGEDAAYLEWVYSGQDKSTAKKGWTESGSRLLCRTCREPVAKEDAAVHTTYWWKCKFLCHKDCQKVGMRAESQACRDHDGNCNDCKHFCGDRFEGTGAGRVRVGRCSKGLVVIENRGDYGFTFDGVPGDGEIRVFPNNPMFVPCFELRGELPEWDSNGALVTADASP